MGGAASGGSGAAAFASGPTPGTTVEDAANAGYPEWMVHEDYSLLQAVQVMSLGGQVLEIGPWYELAVWYMLPLS